MSRSSSAVPIGLMCNVNMLMCMVAVGSDVERNDWACRPRSDNSQSSLEKLVEENCGKVKRAELDFNRATAEGVGGDSHQAQVWARRTSQALSLCSEADEKLRWRTVSRRRRRSDDGHNLAFEAANMAANAWGSVIMNGDECCTSVNMPYCERQSSSTCLVALFCILIVLLFLMVVASVASACRRTASPTVGEHEPLVPAVAARGEPSPSSLASSSSSKASSGLQAELEEAWLRSSCLRVLPGAQGFAKAAASLIGGLQEKFDFQRDSALNQFEHLLSMWRSHCAMVADRAVGKDANVDEEHLLAEALGDLHAELLDGYLSWRQNLCNHGAANVPSRQRYSLPSLGGVSWQAIPSQDCGDGTTEQVAKELAVQLAEIATYLMVWGEAGNLRFMPEAVYFLTELVLAADAGEIYDRKGWTFMSRQTSKRFLAKIVRPIYNVVFDEWYDSVDVDSNQKDKKQLHKGMDAFLPPDTANYDDWNELFCTPEQLTERLSLADGARFFGLPHGQRFRAAAHVDWKQSLKAAETKTHREIHSLWGVFATVHRVLFLHLVLFMISCCMVADDALPVLGRRVEGRFAAVGLLVPVHASLWLFARWQVIGHSFRLQRFRELYLGWGSLQIVAWALPLVTYIVLRSLGHSDSVEHTVILIVHYCFSALGFALLVFRPGREESAWDPTQVPLGQRFIRYAFWLTVLAAKFWFGLQTIQSVQTAVAGLNFVKPGYSTPTDLSNFFHFMDWSINPFMWSMIWGTSFVLYLADTQLWFVVGCSVLGVATVLKQRSWRCVSFVLEDAVAKIPERFSKLVLPYAKLPDLPEVRGSKEGRAAFSPCFPLIWDRIVEHLRYEDDIDDELMGELTFTKIGTHTDVRWRNLQQPLGHVGECNASKTQEKLCKSGCGCKVQPGLDKRGLPYDTCCSNCAIHPGTHDQMCLGRSNGARSLAVAWRPHQWEELVAWVRGTETETTKAAHKAKERRVKLPEVFREKGSCEVFFKHYFNCSDPHWPENPDVQWRLVTLARCLTLPMPRPFRAPYFPGLTVLIPHYGESILTMPEELYKKEVSGTPIVPPIDWIRHHWPDEFKSFVARMGKRANEDSDWRQAVWDDYSPEGLSDVQWDKLSMWSAMRMQTLWRTVAGMCQYYPALQCHYEAQADRSEHVGRLARPGVWDPSDCFTCLVSMQMYKYFNATQLAHTNRMFEKFPDCLKVAFIDSEDKDGAADADCVHPRQRRRYFSCLVDRSCNAVNGRRRPRYRVELPGYPILGDGKGDNQNHAMPFMRGTLAQCIDANQGAYFEQMLLLPCVLGEFRSAKRGDGKSKRIIGLPENITSDFGSVGDMAASAELAFGTILQRTYAVLGGRMHYGHPDIMNKLYMMQQGGVSKATKTLNLSEDIFAGMDFTLRGEGRKIKHCEYFHLAKGRDLSFNTVLAFFSKLSSGAGEQILTRQMFRLGQILHLPECLTFYYAHVGYYFNQFLISWSMPLLICIWLLALLSDCDDSFKDFQQCNRSQTANAEVIAKTFSFWFSSLMALFLFASSLPLFMETWMERSLKVAVIHILKQLFTGSPLLFIFQSKVIGSYVVNELRLGGATYVSTGRGLATERRAFLGKLAATGTRLEKVDGLYLDYASIAYYDGTGLLVGVVLVGALGGGSVASGNLAWTWVALALTVTSWLFAPFIYNPYQFMWRYYFHEDWRSWAAFFFEDFGRHWRDWYEKKQLRVSDGCRTSLGAAIFLGSCLVFTWWTAVMLKVEALVSAYSESEDLKMLRWIAPLPPLFASLCLCFCLPAVEWLLASAHFKRLSNSCSNRCKRSPQSSSPPDVGTEAKGCAKIPLVFLAVCVLVFNGAEAAWGLYDFVSAGWRNALVAGIILKYAMLSACLGLAEDVLRAQWFQKIGNWGQPLQLWVYAHRMARDFLTSLIILVTLLPWVFFFSLNDFLCSGFSFHQLLIFRDPGHVAPKDLIVWREESQPTADTEPKSTTFQV